MTGNYSGTLTGQVAIVTGGSAGIGLAVAVSLAARGVSVALVGRNPDRVKAAVARVRSQVPDADVDGLALDVCRRDDMQEMVAAALARHGRIDILVACAGILRPSSGSIRTVRNTTTADWDEVLTANLKGTFLSNQAVLPAMLIRRRGQIINVASTSARRGHAFDAAYCASKFAVVGLSETLAEEVRSSGVRVQVLSPGATESMIWDQNGPIPRPRNVLPVDRLVQAIVYMLELPWDALVPEVIVEPQMTADAPPWSRNPGAILSNTIPNWGH